MLLETLRFDYKLRRRAQQAQQQPLTYCTASVYKIFVLRRDSPEPCKLFGRFLLDVLMEAVAVRVHGDDSGKVGHVEVPHRLRRSEVHQRDAVDTVDRPGIKLGCSSNGVQVHGARLRL